MNNYSVIKIVFEIKYLTSAGTAFSNYTLIINKIIFSHSVVFIFPSLLPDYLSTTLPLSSRGIVEAKEHAKTRLRKLF